LPATFYNENTTELALQYLSKTFVEVHQSWSKFLPLIIENPNVRILDIGAGSGWNEYLIYSDPERSPQNLNKFIY